MAAPIAQFSGIASGIDTAKLIDALIEARETENIGRKAQVEYLTSENDALEELNTKILTLNDLLEKMKTINGGAIRKKAASSVPEVLTAAADGSAPTSSAAITVVGLASTATATFTPTTPYTSTSDKVSSAVGSGDVTIDVGTGTNKVTVTVAVEGGVTTLQDFADKVNFDPNAQGRLSASLVNIGTEGSPSYRIMLNSLVAGTEKGSLAITSDPLHAAQLGTQNLVNSNDARITLAGITGQITRSSNTITDVMSGVTLQLLKDGSSTVSVATDNDATLELVQKVVDAYNDIVSFIEEKDLIEEKQNSKGQRVIIYNALAKTQVDDGFLTEFRSQISQAESANGTSVKKLSELGLATERDGTLSLDSEKFKEALSKDIVGVSEVLTSFADSTSGTEGFLRLYTRFQGVIDVAKTGNDSEIENINDRITEVERLAEKERQTLTSRFARLESQVGQLQSKQAELTSMLSSLR